MLPMIAPHGMMPRYHQRNIREQPIPIMMQPSVAKPVIDSLPTDKEALGERLYSEVEKYEPEEAGKITGMLLEMQVEQIHGMLKDDEQLKRWISKAKEVLNPIPA